MAGALAALSARRAGASVRLVRRALGATAMSSGAVDVAASPFAPGGDLAGQAGDYLEAAAAIARVRPRHPYAVLKGQLSRLPEALAFLVAALPELFDPPGRNNTLLLTPLGTVKPTALAQRSQLGGDLSTLEGPVVVAHLGVNPRFDATLVARGLTAAAKAIGRELEIRAVEARPFRRVEDALRTPYELAQDLDAPGRLEALVEELGHALPPGTRTVLLPPLLGRSTPRLAERLSQALNVRCFEVLSASPSVPGVRLQEALDAALKAAQVELLEMELTRTEDGTLMLAGAPAQAKTVVLATGKFIGGGIRREARFEETLFGLPVFVSGRDAGDAALGELLSERITDDQAAFRAGVRIDASLRPVGADGRPLIPNLFAAGSVLEGYDPASDKTGLGVAAFTGFLAGEAAAEAAGSSAGPGGGASR